jgi:hypothetical protein
LRMEPSQTCMTTIRSRWRRTSIGSRFRYAPVKWVIVHRPPNWVRGNAELTFGCIGHSYRAQIEPRSHERPRNWPQTALWEVRHGLRVYRPLGERLTPKEQHQGIDRHGLTFRIRIRSTTELWEMYNAQGETHRAGSALF